MDLSFLGTGEKKKPGSCAAAAFLERIPLCFPPVGRHRHAEHFGQPVLLHRLHRWNESQERADIDTVQENAALQFKQRRTKTGQRQQRPGPSHESHWHRHSKTGGKYSVFIRV